MTEDVSSGAVGRTLDRKYLLLRLLGKGGMGEVYEARHARTGRRVAVKLLHARLLSYGEEAERRFRREALAIGALQSPHVVQVLDAGEDEETGDSYLVMELLEGADLQQLLRRLGPLRPNVALRLAAQALAGLVRAHEAGIVHRDIKPANLFLARGEGGLVTVKLLDFGVAKVEKGTLATAPAPALTQTDSILGSPLYMAPEQMENSTDVDVRTDLWSLGSVLYCALAGRAPYQHVESVFDLLPAIRAGQAPPLRSLAPWVPVEVAGAVDRAVAVAPEDRYPSAAAMLEAVAALAGGDTTLREEMLAGVLTGPGALLGPDEPRTMASPVEPPAPRSMQPGPALAHAVPFPQRLPVASPRRPMAGPVERLTPPPGQAARPAAQPSRVERKIPLSTLSTTPPPRRASMRRWILGTLGAALAATAVAGAVARGGCAPAPVGGSSLTAPPPRRTVSP